MEALDAATAVLERADGPLHYRDITERILSQKLWSTGGKTPAATVNAAIAVDIRERGGESRFRRVDRGVFALRARAIAGESDPKSSPTVATATQLVRGARETKKLGVKELRDVARRIVRSHPEGIRYGQLLAMVVDAAPVTPRNTVQGSI